MGGLRFAWLLRPSFWRSWRPPDAVRTQRMRRLKSTPRLFCRQTSRAASTTANSPWSGAATPRRSKARSCSNSISTAAHGAIALAYVEWAGESEQMIVVDWAVIRNAADARAFAAALSGAPRSFVGRTAIGSAINFASALFSEAKFATDRRVIDVSGDGTSNQGSPVAAARDAAVGAGAIINALIAMCVDMSDKGSGLWGRR